MCFCFLISSAYLLEELHKEGHSREALEDALRSMPMVCMYTANTVASRYASWCSYAAEGAQGN